MYVGNDQRKWGTVKCEKKRRRVLPIGCEKFEPNKKQGEKA